MANPSVSVPDELLDKFDDIIWQRQMEGELDRHVTRSQIIQELMEDYVEDNEHHLEADT